MIGRSPELSRLQRDARGEEARARLEEACSRLGMRHRLRVLLVFDGVSARAARDAPRPSHLQVVYASGPGRADARIIQEANRLAQTGEPVTVVTDDQGLRGELLHPVQRRGVGEFWKALDAPAAPRRAGRARRPSPEEDEKRPGPLPDVERYFLEAQARTDALKARPKKKGKKA